MGLTSLSKLALLLLSQNLPSISCKYINADMVRELTEKTLGKGNQFDIELSFQNLNGTECQNCTICHVTNGVHALYDGNSHTQLCTTCEGDCPEDYYVHADLKFERLWPMNYFKLTSTQNTGRDPEEVWLKGSKNNGRTWEELDHALMSFSDRRQDKIHTFKNKKYYRTYRLTMRKGKEKDMMELSNYEFASDFLSKFVTDLIYNVVKIQFFQPDIITLYRGNDIGMIEGPIKDYEISFTLFPYESVPMGRRSVLRFTTHSGYTSGHYGATSPYLMVGNNENSAENSGLEFIAYFNTISNKDQFRWTNKSLKLKENNKIKFVVLGDKTRLYLEDEVIATFITPVNDRPSFPRLYVWATDNYYDPLSAQLKHLVYTPISLEEEKKAIQFKPSIMKVIKNVKISTVVEPHNEFQLTFKFNPLGSSSAITSILRLTTDATGKLDKEDGHRVPFIGLYPDSYNMILDYGSESNAPWQYPAELAPRIDNLIKVIALEDNIMLYLNNIYAGSIPYPIVNRPFYDKLYLFVSDNVHNPASGTVSHVYCTPLHENKIAKRFTSVSTIAPYSKYNRVGYFDQLPTSEYIISALIFANKSGSNSGVSIFKISSSSSASNDKTVAMLHYQAANNEKLGMTYVSKNPTEGIKYQSIGFKSEIPSHEEIPVTIVSINNKISFYINDELVDTATAPLVERPPAKRLYVFTSTNYEQFFNGVLRQLEYTPLYKSNQVLLQPTGGALRLNKGYKIGTVSNPRLTNLYEITFTIRPYSTYSDWRSILRFSRPNGLDHTKYGDRAPALWFVPQTRRLHISHGSTDDSSRYFQTQAALSYNQESTVKIITHEDGIISLYVNDQAAGSMYIPLPSRPPIETLEVYTSDKFYNQAYADISHLTYRHIYPNAANEFFMSSAMKPSKNNLIGEISNPSQEYVISCIIRPVGTARHFRNVFRFSRVSPTDADVYGDRIAGLWLQPNSYKPRVHVCSEDDPNIAFTEVGLSFIANSDNDFKMVYSAEEGKATWYVNGQLGGTVSLPRSKYHPLEKLMVYASDSFFESANVFLRQLKYTPVYTKNSIYKFLHTPLTVQRNNLLGVIHDPSPTYTISATIRANSISFDYTKNPDYTSIFRFSQVKSTDADFYGDRSPALLLKPGSYEMILAQGSTSDPNNVINISTKLQSGQDRTVKIVSRDDGFIRVYVNGIISGSAYIPLQDRPNLDKLLVYAGDPYYQSANVQVSNLVYEPVLYPEIDSEEPTVFAPSVTTISRNFKIGQLVNPSSQYVITGTIKPLGTVQDWSCLFRFTSDPSSDAAKYGDRNPLLMLQPNSYDLFSSVIFSGESNYNNIHNMKGLIENQDNEVMIVAQGDEIAYYINDEKVGTMFIPLVDRPQLSLLHVYASDNFYTAANAQVSNLVFRSVTADSPTEFYPKTITLQRDNYIGQVVTTSKHFKIGFTIQPNGIINSKWSSILRFARASYTNSGYQYGSKSPVFYFEPGTTILRSIYFCTRNLNYRIDSTALEMNVESKIEYVAIDDKLSLYINGVESGSVTVPSGNRPLLEKLYVFASDNLSPAADAVVKDLVYTPLESTSSSTKYDPVSLVSSSITLAHGNKVGQLVKPLSQYIISFNIKPLGTYNGWTNILRFTSNPLKESYYGTRSPSLWFHANTYDLHLSQFSKQIAFTQIFNAKGLVANEESNVKVIALGHLIQLYIDDEKVGEVYSPLVDRPPLDLLHIYASSAVAGNVAANAEISNLVFAPIPDIITDPFYPPEPGYCLTGSGADQNSGVTDLGSLTTATLLEQHQECKEKCIIEMNKDVTVHGCEVYANKCFLHTQPVAKGSGTPNDSVCFVADAPIPFKYSKGICVESNGSHSRSSSHRTFLGTTSSDNHCMRKCIEYYDQSTEKNNISGCQWDFSDGDCYVYYLSSYIAVRGNGGSGNMCILKDNYQCSGEKCECGSSHIFQEDYRGTISRTQQGIPCQPWGRLWPHSHSHNSLDRNYCRNPGKGENRPWCYTTDPNKRWDYCDVPKCACGTLSRKEDYRGTLSKTSNGRACQDWNNQTVTTHDYTSANYPTAGLQSNYCRNPGSKSAPWCYTTDPNVSVEQCNVPQCDPLVKTRIYVKTLYNICDRDGWRDESDPYIRVYVNGRYCGQTSVLWDRNPATWNKYFYCGSHNMYSSLRVFFYAYDKDGYRADYLGSTSSQYHTKMDDNRRVYFSGACSGMYLDYSTKLYW